MRRLVFACLFGVLTLANVVADDDVRQDLQQWTAFRVSDPIGKVWTFSFQAELRLQDDISDVQQLIVKPYATYEFSKKLDFSFGYKYIARPDGADEQDPWQEIVFPRKYSDLAVSHQIRLEQRIIDDVSGILPRLRYLVHFAAPIGESHKYWASSGAVRFNLTDKGGTAPVGGFEQVRLYGGVGWHVGGKTRIEVGYLYRYERQRTGPDFSDHVIRAQFLINTRGKKVKKPLPTESYK